MSVDHYTGVSPGDAIDPAAAVEGASGEDIGVVQHARPMPFADRNELRAALEHELKRRSFWLTFDLKLEHHYIRDTGIARIRQDRVAAILGVFVYNLWTITDYLSCPDIWSTAFFFRAVVASPLIIIATWFDRNGRGLRRRSIHQAVLISLATLPLLLIYHGSYYPSVALSYFLFPVILVFGNLNVSISYFWVIVANIGMWAGCIAAVLTDHTVPTDFLPALIVFMSSLILITITAKHRIEGSERRAWLMTKLGDIRSAELKELAETLSVESKTDALTGAVNRRQLDRALTRMCRAREGGALILFDIDHFKRYNDRYGHQAGDLALQRVVAAATTRIRAHGDVVARYGGEEFAVLLPACPLDRGLLVAEGIRLAVLAETIPHEALGADRVLTISLGVAVFPPGITRAPADLVAEADRLLYAAKAAGRNCVRPVADVTGPYDLDEIEWVEDLAVDSTESRVA